MAEHDAVQVRVIGRGDVDERAEVVGVVRQPLEPHPLAARAAVPAEIERVRDQPGVAEPLCDVVVPAGVLGVTVAEHHDSARGALGRPDVVDDPHSCGAVERAFVAGGGISRA